jgi:hypothetical protein
VNCFQCLLVWSLVVFRVVVFKTIFMSIQGDLTKWKWSKGSTNSEYSPSCLQLNKKQKEMENASPVQVQTMNTNANSSPPNVASSPQAFNQFNLPPMGYPLRSLLGLHLSFIRSRPSSRNLTFNESLTL